MVKVEVKNLEGKKVEDIELNDSVFGLDVKEQLVKEVFVAQSANLRISTAHTKTRGERSGSGRKPWKQKGTGRARTGSIRNPIWRKGGIIFGPRSERDFSKKVNRKVARKALLMTLSSKLKENQLVVLDKFELKENKTKLACEAFNKLKIESRALLVYKKDETGFSRSTRNLPNIRLVNIDSINVVDLLNNKFLVLSKDGILNLEKRLSGNEVVKKESKRESIDIKKKNKEVVK